jgi:excisionase family DNA binding protein
MLATAYKLLTVRQVAHYLGVHVQTIYALVRNGELKALQPGGPGHSIRIDEGTLHEWLNGSARNSDAA